MKKAGLKVTVVLTAFMLKTSLNAQTMNIKENHTDKKYNSK